MKFKGKKFWREMVHTDVYGDSLVVHVERDDDPCVYIAAEVAVALSYKQARNFANKILKELDR